MEIDALIDDYLNFLKKEITCTKMGEYYEITTPFLDAYNDYLQIYVKQEKNRFYFTDDGFSIQALNSMGVALTKKRKEQISQIAKQFGVRLENGELKAESEISEFGRKKHMFVQALLRINDMYMTAQNRVSSFFLDDVNEYFAQNEIYVSENITITGQTGFNHLYDFLLPRSQKRPERFCTIVNHPTRTNIENSIFSWLDTKEVRKNDSQFILFVNDTTSIPQSVESAVANYDIVLAKWSERNQKCTRDLFAA